MNFLGAKRFEAMLLGVEETVIVQVSIGEKVVKSKTAGWCPRWNHWIKIPKNYIIGVRVDV